MSHVDFHTTLGELYDNAVSRYESGQRGASTFFTDGELAFLASIGHTAQEVYDFAEDRVKYGAPDRETFLMVAALRRFYFLNVQRGQRSNRIVDTPDLPAKTESAQGIEWLPRIIEKARAKLRGEMSDDLMFLCGGDRAFFARTDIHPSEFLLVVMQHFEDTEAIIDFVVKRSKASGHS